MFTHGNVDGIQSNIRKPNIAFSDAMASREFLRGVNGCSAQFI
jgi:hypothetical protein